MAFACFAKKSPRKEGAPRVARPASPAALRYSGGRAASANLGLCPSNSARRLPPAALRCSALHEGEESTPNGSYRHTVASLIGSRFTLCVVEQRKTQRDKGRGLSEGHRPEFRSPPVAAEQRRAPGESRATLWARFLLGYFFLADKKKYLRLQAKPSVNFTKICWQGV